MFRQELVRRNAFDLTDEKKINFKTLLARLMVELVKEEDEATLARENEILAARATAALALKKERDLKKQEALERSKQRQSDPNYFKKISESNIQPEKSKVETAEVCEEDNEESPTTESEIDPFRIVKSTKSKIYIK